jgi:hypothetical protein
MNSVRENLSKWIKEPSSWFSLAAFLTSVITFYFNWPRAASLQLYVPNKVPMRFFGHSHTSLDVRLPIYIYNTGSSGNAAIVEKANAQIRFSSGNGPAESIKFSWVSTARLLTAREFKTKNADLQLQEGAEDYFDQESRDVPFAIQGKETAFKYFQFSPESQITNLTPPVVLEISVALTTMDGRTYELKNSRRYKLSAEVLDDSINRGIFEWIPEVDSNVR